MTHTETNCYAIPRETIEISRRRARRLRSRVAFRLVGRMMRRLSPGGPQPAAVRPALQPV
ncbi:MAG: hypothetical protein ACREVS_05280 [Burkholderiales bacterium]